MKADMTSQLVPLNEARVLIVSAYQNSGWFQFKKLVAHLFYLGDLSFRPWPETWH